MVQAHCTPPCLGPPAADATFPLLRTWKSRLSGILRRRTVRSSADSRPSKTCLLKRGPLRAKQTAMIPKKHNLFFASWLPCLAGLHPGSVPGTKFVREGVVDDLSGLAMTQKVQGREANQASPNAFRTRLRHKVYQPRPEPTGNFFAMHSLA